MVAVTSTFLGNMSIVHHIYVHNFSLLLKIHTFLMTTFYFLSTEKLCRQQKSISPKHWLKNRFVVVRDFVPALVQSHLVRLLHQLVQAPGHPLT